MEKNGTEEKGKLVETKLLPQRELRKMIAQETPYSQAMIEEVLSAYYYVLDQVIRNGFRVRIGNIGFIGGKAKESLPSKDRWNPYTQKVEYMPQKPDYIKPFFAMSTTYRDKLKKETRKLNLREPVENE